MTQNPLSGLTPLLSATYLIIVQRVAQTVSDFRVAVDLLRKLLMTFALRLDLLHKPLLTLALRLNLLRLLLKPPAAFTHLFQIARCAPL